MDPTPDKPVSADSPATARRRTQYKWVRAIFWTNGVICFGAMGIGWVLDWLDRGDLIDQFGIVWIVIPTIPFVFIGIYTIRRFKRALEVAERRDRAGAQRSSELEVVPVQPLIYETQGTDSPETARLRAQNRRNLPLNRTALVVFAIAAVLLIAEVAVVFTALTCALAIVYMAFLRYRDWRNGSLSSQLEAAEKRDRVEQRAAAIANAQSRAAGPVLYLRSFSDDERAGRRYGALTEEEHLARALAWIGPLVAVGRPGELLPQVGAQRVYLTDDTWQERVSELMKTAAMVVLRTGSSEGFHWEVKKALSILSPERLLIVVDSRRELGALLDAIATHLGKPRAKFRCRGRSIGTVKGFVTFDSEWTPRPLRLTRGRFRGFGDDGPLAGRFVLSLRPLFDQRGIAYQLPPWSMQKIGWVAYLVVFAIAIFIANIIEDRQKSDDSASPSVERVADTRHRV